MILNIERKYKFTLKSQSNSGYKCQETINYLFQLSEHFITISNIIQHSNEAGTLHKIDIFLKDAIDFPYLAIIRKKLSLKAIYDECNEQNKLIDQDSLLLWLETDYLTKKATTEQINQVYEYKKYLLEMFDQREDEFGNDEDEKLKLFAEVGPCILEDAEFGCHPRFLEIIDNCMEKGLLVFLRDVIVFQY